MRARDIGVGVEENYNVKDKDIILEYSSKNMYVVDYYYEGRGGWNYATCSDYRDDKYLVFFTISQIIQYSNLVNWDYFTENNILTISILNKLYDFIKWRRIIYNGFIDEKIIEHYRDDIKLIRASRDRKYSEEFLYRNAEYLDWTSICEYNKLSEKFMRDFDNKLDWYKVTSRQNLSTSFMEYYGDKINWFTASSRQDLSENLIEKYSDKLYWKDISEYQVLSKELIERNMHRLDLLKMKYNKKMIQAYGQEYLNNLYVKANTISKLDSSEDINLIMKRTFLIAESVIEEHIDKIDWSLGCYLKLSESFMIKYENKIDWSKMGKNEGLTKSIIKRHWGELCKKDLISGWVNDEKKTFSNYCITTAYKEVCDENIGVVYFIKSYPLRRNYRGDYETIKPDFGFIKNKYHEKIFFNISGENYKLEVGDYVKFKIVQGSKGIKAIHIKKLKELPIDINGYNKQGVKGSNINNNKINAEENNYRIKEEIKSTKESKNINENLYNERGFYKNTARHRNGTKYDDFGFDKFGYDENGYDKNGIDKYGYNKQGVKDNNINNNKTNAEENNYRIKEKIKNVINKLKDKLTGKLFKD